jgi:hypothetical protein
VTTTGLLKTPVRLGKAVSYEDLTVVPLFAESEPDAEFISLDEALARGLSAEEFEEAGVVESVRVMNPLDSAVLLYEGEQIAGAKQDRIFRRHVLVPEHANVEVVVSCVERGRWSYRSRHFTSSPHGAYPRLRYAGHALGQVGVWDELSARSRQLGADSDTDAAEAMYVSSRRRLADYLAAIPGQLGQCGSIVAIGGKPVCLDFISRADVHALVYPKLLSGYALDAIGALAPEADADDGTASLLQDIATAEREPIETAGKGKLRRLFSSRILGYELVVGEEVLALAAFAT